MTKKAFKKLKKIVEDIEYKVSLVISVILFQQKREIDAIVYSLNKESFVSNFVYYHGGSRVLWFWRDPCWKFLIVLSKQRQFEEDAFLFAPQKFFEELKTSE